MKEFNFIYYKSNIKRTNTCLHTKSDLGVNISVFGSLLLDVVSGNLEHAQEKHTSGLCSL